MADISLVQDDCLDDSDEGVFDQGDGPSPGDVGDETLPPLHRIKKYAYSENIYNRQMVSRVLLELFKMGPADGLATDLAMIMDIIAKLAEDDETMVRTDVLEQIPHLAAIAAECSNRVPALANIVSEHLLPVVVRNLGTSDNQVRKTAHTTLFALMEQGLVTKAQAEIQVCPTVLALSRKECLMYYHTGAITLMSKMAPLLGRDVTERVFLDRFSELCSNQMFYVRKVCASHFGDFCAVVGKDAYEKILLPAYIKLSSDEIWGVRKACADVATLVSCACPAIMRRTVLAPVFSKLLQDDSRWVRISAFQTLGPFISTFADPPITSMAYMACNNMGELVLVNADGSEFKINNPSMPTSSDEVKHLFGLSVYDLNDVDDYFDDKKEPKIENVSLEIEQDNNKNDEDAKIYEDKKDDFVNNFFQDDDDDDTITIHQDVKEDVILQKSFDIVSKNMYGEVIDANLCNKENEQTTQEIVVSHSDSTGSHSDSAEVIHYDCPNYSTIVSQLMIDEFIDHIKNTEIDFNQQGGESTIDVIYENKLCDNLDIDKLSRITQDLNKLDLKNVASSSSTTADNNLGPGGDGVICGGSASNLKAGPSSIAACSASTAATAKKAAIEGKDEDEDSLDLYNSYNYWYVPPDMMALCPSFLIDAGIPLSNINIAASASSIITTNIDTTLQPLDELDAMDEDLDGTYSLNSTYPIKESPKKLEPMPPPSEPTQQIVPQVLIDHFISMAYPTIAQTTNENITYHCAFSLPAVALTLGSSNWDLLKDIVEILAVNMQYKVRRTVASSLHELALILGPEIATTHLTPIFEGFIKDLDEVRIGVLKHLAHFLRLINPSKRSGYLPILTCFLQTDNELNWRFRHELAEQLLLAVRLFPPIDASKHISSIAQRLLCDKVSAVRQVALQLLTELLRHVSSEPGLTPRLLVKFAEKFAHSKKWKLRQTFVLLSSELLACRALPLDQFSSEIMPHLLDLSWDPVANVRLVVARTIATQIITNDICENPHNGLAMVLRRLQADKDRDVRQSALSESCAINP